MCVTVAKVGQGRPKSKVCSGCLTPAILPNMNVLAQVVGVLELEKRKVRQGVLTFLRR